MSLTRYVDMYPLLRIARISRGFPQNDSPKTSWMLNECGCLRPENMLTVVQHSTTFYDLSQKSNWIELNSKHVFRVIVALNWCYLCIHCPIEYAYADFELTLNHSLETPLKFQIILMFYFFFQHMNVLTVLYFSIKTKIIINNNDINFG